MAGVNVNRMLQHRPPFGDQYNDSGIDMMLTMAATSSGKQKTDDMKALKSLLDHFEMEFVRTKSAAAKTRRDWLRSFLTAAATTSVAAPAAAGAVEINLSPGTKPVVIKKTLDNGDCFYSSVYRAAQEQGLLPLLLASIDELAGVRNEIAFIAGMRMRVAREIRAGRLPTDEASGLNAYNSLSTALENYDAITSSYPRWFREVFANARHF